MTNEYAIKILGNYHNGYFGYKIDDVHEAHKLAIKALEESNQGEWIITREEQGAFGIIYKRRKCNRCGWESSLLIPRNFCPNCGAEMRGKKND